MFGTRNKKQAILVAFMMIAVLLFSACAAPTPVVVEKVVTPTPVPPAPVPDVIKIGVYEPMTGAFAAGGEMTYEGVELAHEYKSEVLGKPVEVVLVDNSC